MTRQEFIEKNRHEIGGLCMDMLQNANGPELSVRIRLVMRKIDVLLSNAYEDLCPTAPTTKPVVPQANGRAVPTKEKA